MSMVNSVKSVERVKRGASWKGERSKEERPSQHDKEVEGDVMKGEDSAKSRPHVHQERDE